MSSFFLGYNCQCNLIVLCNVAIKDSILLAVEFKHIIYLVDPFLIFVPTVFATVGVGDVAAFSRSDSKHPPIFRPLYLLGLTGEGGKEWRYFFRECIGSRIGIRFPLNTSRHLRYSNYCPDNTPLYNPPLRSLDHSSYARTETTMRAMPREKKKNLPTASQRAHFHRQEGASQNHRSLFGLFLWQLCGESL